MDASRVQLDMMYNVSRLAGPSIDVTHRDFFVYNGVPVYEQEYCYKQVVCVKEWSRLNRPPKTKRTYRDVPAIYILGGGLTGNAQTIIAHPEIFKKIKEL